jgi:glucose/arabinose dehydrogenase
MKQLILVFFLTIACVAFGQLETQQIEIPSKFLGRLESGHELRIDGQYKVDLFYIDNTTLKRPRFMAIGPNNVLYVADLNAKRIFAIPDFDGDGVGDSAFIAAPDVDSAHSLYIWNDTMYVAEPDRVRKFVDAIDHDGVFETEVSFITGIHSSGPYNHYTRTILIDTIKKSLYLSIGASCNACREENYQRATIMQFSLNGFSSKVYATGLRNAIGLAIDLDSNQLWATNADRDYLGDDIPPEIVTPVADNGFYGWPFAYGNKVWVDFTGKSEYQAMLPLTATDSQLVASMQVAPIMLEAHSTPMGIIFYDDPRTYIQAPPKTMLIARHGSSKGGRPVGLGYDVLRFQQDKQTKQWSRDTFLTGFLTDSINYTYWGRPCGITQDSSGAYIYLSSDVGVPAIYRISLKDLNKVDKEPGEAKPSLYPNPTEGSFVISLSEDADIKLYTVLGQEVATSIERIGTGYRVSLSRQESGLFFCRVNSGGVTYSLPVIIQ